MASVHLEKGEEAGEWEEGGLAKSPRRIPARGWPGGQELPPSQEASAPGGSPLCAEPGRTGWDYGASPLVPVGTSLSVPWPACSAPPLLWGVGSRLFHWALLWDRWRSMFSDRALGPVKRAHSRKSGSTM